MISVEQWPAHFILPCVYQGVHNLGNLPTEQYDSRKCEQKFQEADNHKWPNSSLPSTSMAGSTSYVWGAILVDEPAYTACRHKQLYRSSCTVTIKGMIGVIMRRVDMVRMSISGTSSAMSSSVALGCEPLYAGMA